MKIVKNKAVMTALRSGAAIKMAALSAALLLGAGVASAVTYTGTCGATAAACSWSLNTTDSTLTITGSGTMTNYSSSSVPWRSNLNYVRNVNISGVTSIGSSAFYNCSALTSVTIGNSVRTIGNRVFNDCFALTSITVERTLPITGSSNIFSFSFPYITADLYVTAEAVDAYRTTEPWSTFRRIIAIGSTPAPVTFNCGYCGTSTDCTPTSAVTATLDGNTLTITRNSGTGQMFNSSPLWGLL